MLNFRDHNSRETFVFSDNRLRSGYRIGSAIDEIITPVVKFLFQALIILGILSIPCAAIKYLFWG